MTSNSDSRGSLVVGLSHPQKNSPDAASLLQLARDDGYDYVTTALPTTLVPRSDVTELESRWWRTSVVGVIHEQPDWLSHLKKQMEWAAHMSIPAVILPLGSSEDYCRAVCQVALEASATNGQVWIKTRLTQEDLSQFEILSRYCDGSSNVGIMLILDEHNVPATLAAASVATVTLAKLMTLVHKAIGSQLKAVSFPTRAFLTNKRGYPTLSKAHQTLFTEILRRIGRTVRVLIEGPSVHTIEVSAQKKDNPMGETRCLPYLQYIRHMRQRNEIASMLDTPEAAMEEPYLDHLQRPLQPLSDHLEFQTYETFEKDPVKYSQYQRAILLALRDGWSTVVNQSKATRVSICIIGAGRGPLVTAALDAIAEVRKLAEFEGQPPLQAQIWAVEKNPSAVLYLESMAQHSSAWQSAQVKVLHMDARLLTKASVNNNEMDIVVSELLGSFGDNELSPECLDGLESTGLLKDTTVCIPQEYSSFLAPVSSMRMHSEARSQAYYPASSSDGLDSSAMGTLRAMETPYVVRSHAACQTNVERLCWKFRHFGGPNKKERECHLMFNADPHHGAGCGGGYGPYDTAVAAIAQGSGANTSQQVVVHGLLGTFSAVLYASGRDGVVVSISSAPTTFSAGMFSWFPLYFPLKEPILIPGGCGLSVSMWRRVETLGGNIGNNTNNSGGTMMETGRVWYEWCAKVVDKHGEVYSVTPIHNPNGRSCHVDM